MARPEFLISTAKGEEVRGLPCKVRAVDEEHALRLVEVNGSIDWTPMVIDEESKAVTDVENPIKLKVELASKAGSDQDEAEPDTEAVSDADSV